MYEDRAGLAWTMKYWRPMKRALVVNQYTWIGLCKKRSLGQPYNANPSRAVGHFTVQP